MGHVGCVRACAVGAVDCAAGGWVKEAVNASEPQLTTQREPLVISRYWSMFLLEADL